MQEHEEPPPGLFNAPFADPQIQLDYEAAFGAFLVAFNRIENTVNDIIILALQQSERADILKRVSGDSFRHKLITLDLIALAYPDALPQKIVNELAGLANHRNKLAHGHFHQNPFDGSYKIVTDRRELPMQICQLVQLTERANRASNALGYAEAHFSFEYLDTDEKS